MLRFIAATLISLLINIERAEGARWIDADLKSDPRWALRLIESQRIDLEDTKPVIVAIIDTGLDIKHPDFKDRLWINDGESGKDENGKDKSTNGVDDDKNGFVDDIHGWNFAGANNSLFDSHGHGTHIAGIVAGSATGVAKSVKIMVLKYYDPASSPIAPMTNTIRSIEYATKMGAQIINFSAGGRDPNPNEKDVIAKASAKDILFVAAAGNEQLNSDFLSYYPADYEISNIISVGAITQEGRLSEYSNYGERTVDLVAPGGPIVSTAPGGRYELMSGTSQATAFVTGVAAILISKSVRKLRPSEIIERLTSTGKPNPNLRKKVRYEVQLNAFRALVMKDSHESAGGLTVTNSRQFDHQFFTAE